MRFYILFCFAFGFVVAAERPNVVVISVDTLRADRLSAYGYERLTSPNIDKLLADGVRFDQARTPEPLTAPALTSMLTSLYPHQHGASRNGLRMKPELLSVGKVLKSRGYQTAAFVSNWTLRDGLSGLGEHFDDFGEILNRKRWFGLFLSEATAMDVTDEAADWLADADDSKPFFLWVHYTDPHAPYRKQDEFLTQTGYEGRANLTKAERYDTEIAFTDHHIKRFLDSLWKTSKPEKTIVIFTADHGENLGEQGYWGHGRFLHESGLRVPLGFVWKGVIKPGVESAPAQLIDLPPTILSLVGIEIPPVFEGYDWAPRLETGKAPLPGRLTYYQAHKGAVQTKSGAERGRQRGLLEVGLIQEHRKEIFRVKGAELRRFDLAADPHERHDLATAEEALSQPLIDWALAVEKGLNRIKTEGLNLSDQDKEMLRSLGYIE